MHIPRLLVCLALASVVLVTPAWASEWLLDNDSIAQGSGRTVSGPNIASGWTVFQPFTVPEPGWDIETIGVDGWNVQDPLGYGMLGTLLPDTGANYPDESNPIASAVYYLGTDAFSQNWRDQSFDLTLQPGHYWMMWTDNGDANHWSAVFPGVSGENSFSRRTSDGAEFASNPTALRIFGTEVPEPGTICLLLLGAGLLRRK
jgi:hypothetical protein